MSKRKFNIGDRVVINEKYKGVYNCINSVGTITSFHYFNNGKYKYTVKWDDKSFLGEYYSYELNKDANSNDSKLKIGDKVILTEKAKLWLIENGYKIDLNKTYTIMEITYFYGEFYRLKGIDGVHFYEEDLKKVEEKEKPVVKIETALGDVITNDSELIEKLIGKQTDDRITFHEDILPGHAEISDTGAISWVVDWNKLPEQPKKDKPIQMVEFREQDVVDKNTEIKARIAQWNDVCNEYLKAFCDKHEWPYEPDMWVGNDIGTIVMIGDMFVSMDNIRYDIDNDIPEEYFTKWYWKSLDVHELTDGAENYMNYENYCKGCPDYWTEERMQSIRESKARIEKAKKALEDEIQNIGKGELF